MQALFQPISFSENEKETKKYADHELGFAKLLHFLELYTRFWKSILLVNDYSERKGHMATQLITEINNPTISSFFEKLYVKILIMCKSKDVI